MSNCTSNSNATQTIAKKTILIGAGKGGVGKSTVSVNLAVALAEKGLKVGLLDADLYGPSIPIMMGLRQLSPQQEGEKIVPFHKFGVHTISLGFFLDEERSVLWRGPMLHKMLAQMITGVAWPQLDILIVDLPPGTGDVPLSLAKLLNISGAIVVTTPQEVAIRDVVKALHAFEQLKIPLLGYVENLALDRPIALDLPCLAKISYTRELQMGGDEGRPYPKPFAQLAAALE